MRHSLPCGLLCGLSLQRWPLAGLFSLSFAPHRLLPAFLASASIIVGSIIVVAVAVTLLMVALGSVAIGGGVCLLVGVIGSVIGLYVVVVVAGLAAMVVVVAIVMGWSGSRWDGGGKKGGDVACRSNACGTLLAYT
ncbi:hypothetical protein HYPSUDRAFT_199160 [Hypholoma sublateritium FD-334 SS-4]|uniref:Uncharacterized protein n=1 Tax=Hypholoma sublateritium (strain FD-334 SS-4) TaxID=945553 RepID=A0A0D2LEH4_HYPSF|nr:hypothetical protein HYPSUDRAFT_199160 [Hypholoma sublateritium FD-334 SS-4]